MTIGTLAALLLLGTVVGGSAAIAQTTIAPNGGAGVPGMPGNETGPAPRLGEQFNIGPDQSNLPGLSGNKSVPALQPRTGLQNQAQGNEEEDEDLGGFFGHHPGMTGMMGRGYGHRHGWPEGRPVVHSTIMRIIFGMIDANGDGKLSLEEWQAAHERIFKAMDTNHDGTVSFEEMEAFMHGR